MATYYIDADSGSDSNTGLSIAQAWKTLNKFIDVFYTPAGTIGIFRRGRTANYATGSMSSLSTNGTITAPITIEADYDNAWGDFRDSDQTYTLTANSKTVVANTTITNLASGDWIYNLTDGDNSRTQSYEVDTVVGDTITLFLPFKGTAGSAKTLRIMPKSPEWSSIVTNYTIDLTGIVYLIFRGFAFFGRASAGIFSYGNSNIAFENCSLDGGAGNTQKLVGSGFSVNSTLFRLDRCRVVNGYYFYASQAGPLMYAEHRNCLISISGNIVNQNNFAGSYKFYDSEIICPNPVYEYIKGGCTYLFRNCQMTVSGKMLYTSAPRFFNSDVIIEDYNGVKGDNRVYSYFGDHIAPSIQTEFTEVRLGGNATSVKVIPSTFITANEYDKRLEVINIPMYLDTTLRTINVYVRSGDTAQWTTNPTASQLFLELEYYQSTSLEKILLKSTSAVDFKSSLDWQAIAITVQATVAGLATLKLVYTKTKESSKSNIFYVDPGPIIVV